MVCVVCVSTWSACLVMCVVQRFSGWLSPSTHAQNYPPILNVCHSNFEHVHDASGQPTKTSVVCMFLKYLYNIICFLSRQQSWQELKLSSRQSEIILHSYWKR